MNIDLFAVELNPCPNWLRNVLLLYLPNLLGPAKDGTR
jgi:hypothetical protein